MQEMRDCPVCDGEGQIEEHCRQCEGSGEGLHDGTTCRQCGGAGGIHERCENCGGNGEVSLVEYAEYYEQESFAYAQRCRRMSKEYFAMEKTLRDIIKTLRTGDADLTAMRITIEEVLSR